MAVQECIYSGGGGINNYYIAENHAQSTADNLHTHSLNNHKGEKLIVAVYAAGSGTASPTIFDGCTCSGGTLTKLGNLFWVASYGYGTFYEVDVTSDTASITLPSNYTGYMLAFGVQ